MDRNLSILERNILIRGIDDWVHIPEAVGCALRVLGGSDETEALPVAIKAIKNLVQAGLAEVGSIGDTFTPWTGDVLSQIDKAAEQAKFPLQFGDLFWISNTPTGDKLGEQLLTTKQNR